MGGGEGGWVVSDLFKGAVVPRSLITRGRKFNGMIKLASKTISIVDTQEALF